MTLASNPKRTASSKEYRCSICRRVFDSIETLNSHNRMDHSQEGLSATCRSRLIMFSSIHNLLIYAAQFWQII